MGKTVCDLEATELLKFKTLVLKVLIHCEGCRKKVKKVVQSIEGVYRTDIDPLQHKVVVIGSIDAEIVIKHLLKKGKQAEIWPESNITNTTTNIDDKSDTNQERKKPSVSGILKKYAENEQENLPENEDLKKIRAEGKDKDYSSTAKHSKSKNSSPQTNPADQMPLENKIPANKTHEVKPTEKIFEKVTTIDVGCGSGGNSSNKTKKKLDKKAEKGEGRIISVPPPVMIAGHFPPPSTNAPAPSNNPIPPLFQPITPAPEYKEAMTYNVSSHYCSNAGSAFYAPPTLQYAYSAQPGNGYYPPPPPDSIRLPFTHHNDYYCDDDDEIGCSIM